MAERNKARVDLSALYDNAKTLKRRSGVRLCAVVKANAYGHGAEAVANALHGVADCFAVALTDEGVALRYAGVTKPILLLSPPLSEEEVRRAIFHGLSLTVDGVSTAKRAVAAAKSLGEPACVHLAVDTGMHRLGVTEKDLPALLDFCKNAAPHLRVDGAFSHFADGKNEKFTAEQYSSFLRTKTEIKRAFPDAIFHIGATDALSYGRKYAMDMVRIGLGLYGYGATGVRPVLRVTAPVLRYGYAEGERLGYGEENPYRGEFALCRFGYADGIPRAAGVLTPHCMDLSFFPGHPGEIELLGPHRTAEDAAKEEGTLPYEILCRYTARCEFEYLR